MKLTKRVAVSVCVLLLTGGIFGLTAIDATRLKKPHRESKPATSAVVLMPDTFKPTCTSPSFPNPPPKNPLGIDTQCGVSGSGIGAEGQQDTVKNNFCAKGTPKPVTVAYLTSLQAKVEKKKSINFGDEKSGSRMKGPTTNRAPLKTLGEGQMVTLKAYVLIARQEGGESVNCKANVPDESLFHDIHISLVASKDVSDECSGVVAEMSPHHRPDDWTHTNVDKVSKQKLLVRVTGQLYFDSSHFPCSNGQGVRSNPKRVSLWEIHPIYKFEVCTADCDGEGQWLALDVWAKQPK